MTEALILLVGIAAGAITGLIGASGVMVVVPALMLLGYSPAASIGASLFIDTIASLIVAWTYYQHRNLVVKDGFWIAVGSVLGAQGGSYLSTVVPSVGLGGSFNIFLLVSAVFLWINGKRGSVPYEVFVWRHPRAALAVERCRMRPRAFGLALGAIVGVISGFFGAGGGIMILLILVFVMSFEMHEGIGTSTLIMAFTAASGTAGHLVTGDLPIAAAALGAVGTVLGGRLSAKFANRIDADSLSKIAAAVFAALAVCLFAAGGYARSGR